MNSIRGLFLLGVPHVRANDDRDKLAAAMGRKVEKTREKVLSNDMMCRIQMSAMKFRRMALDSNFFVISAYSDSPKKRALYRVFSDSPTVTILLPNNSVRA